MWKNENNFKLKEDGQFYKMCLTCMDSDKRRKEQRRDELREQRIKDYLIEQVSTGKCCGCGGKYTSMSSKMAHERTTEHLEWMNSTRTEISELLSLFRQRRRENA